MCNYSVTAFARNDNATSTVMAGSLTGSAFNIVFDYIFMFYGTWIFRCSTCNRFLSGSDYAGMFYSLSEQKMQYWFQMERLSLRHLISCCQLGVSAFVGEISSAVITFIFNMLILGLTGSTGVAAYGVVANMSLVGMAIMNGMSQGAQPADQ